MRDSSHSTKQKNLENSNWSEKRHIYPKTTCFHGSKEVYIQIVEVAVLEKIKNQNFFT